MYTGNLLMPGCGRAKCFSSAMPTAGGTASIVTTPLRSRNDALNNVCTCAMMAHRKVFQFIVTSRHRRLQPAHSRMGCSNQPLQVRHMAARLNSREWGPACFGVWYAHTSSICGERAQKSVNMEIKDINEKSLAHSYTARGDSFHTILVHHAAGILTFATIPLTKPVPNQHAVIQHTCHRSVGERKLHLQN